MKKLLFGAAALFLMMSCSGNVKSEKTLEDSPQADSQEQVDESTVSATGNEQDSSKMDTELKNETTDKEEKSDNTSKADKEEKAKKETSQYDDLVSQYVASVNNLEKAAYAGKWDKITSLGNKHDNLRNKINKVKNNLSPEQKAKVKKAEKKYDRLLNGVIAA